jgi:hypothetical protein
MHFSSVHPPMIMDLSKDSVFRKGTGIELAPHAMQSLLSPYSISQSPKFFYKMLRFQRNGNLKLLI